MENSEKQPPPAWQSWLSLAVMLHGICIAVALSANYSPSELQTRVLAILSPYLNGLGFHPAGTPYYLTQGEYLDVDWRLEWLPAGEDENDEESWQTAIPVAGRVSPMRQRERMLLREFAASSGDTDDPGAEGRAAELARSLARYLRLERELPAVALRLRRHTLQPPEAIRSPDPEDRDPDSPLYFDVVYRAAIVVDGDRVEIIGRASEAEEAATRGVTP